MAEEIATLAGGCFWCTEAAFKLLKGVLEVVPGYAGGHVPHPTYEAVCTGTTGHREAVQVRFDPEMLPYADLVRYFFAVHDPTSEDRQGPDVGPQYSPAIFYHSEEQRRVAEAVMRGPEPIQKDPEAVLGGGRVVDPLDPEGHTSPLQNQSASGRTHSGH
jgi:peptide-methionine (S)-S-oxide reductase